MKNQNKNPIKEFLKKNPSIKENMMMEEAITSAELAQPPITQDWKEE